MRQHPLLRWIEQAEARRATGAACYEYRAIVSADSEARRLAANVGSRWRRWLRPWLRSWLRSWPWLRRLRPLRAANDLC